MKIRLPRHLQFDTRQLPEDFDQRIHDCFRDYTEGTHEDYTYEDKLAFLDLCARYLHNSFGEDEAVKRLILEQTEWKLDEYGDLPEPEDYNCMDFMQQCFLEGRYGAELRFSAGHHRNLDRHDAEELNKLMCRIINTVMAFDWAKEEKHEPVC